jgi:hypothetical protein
MGNPVVHFEISGRDSAKLGEFYSGLFGWTIDSNNPMNYGLVHTGEEGGIDGGIGQSDESWVTFYVQVADPQRYLDEAVKRGGRVVRPVDSGGPVVTAAFADPEGHMIGLVKLMEPVV